MKKYLLLPSLLLHTFILFSQTEISGVINLYTSVLEIDYCQSRIRVSDASSFQPGQSVLLIQMQGASIETDDGNTFGTVLELNNTGNFERALIETITANDIFLTNSLLKNYLPDQGIVQLLTIPVYEEATVSDTLTAAAWSGTVGGILAIDVQGTLTLNADIDVSGKGFRGGISGITDNNNCNFLFNQNDYSYPANTWRAALKGEGIALPLSGQEAGRGAPANGGGGGNDHNSGGGGGGLLSAGGQGGRNDEPTNFGCDGNFPGLGGWPLLIDTNLVFLGGGGGAGHDNNNQGSNGGAGGGIIFLWADSIAGNNFRIAANGETALEARGDGAGGGGAGGSIVLESKAGNASFFLEATGGSGGDSNNANSDRCYGPGGGGSGGYLLLSTQSPIPVSIALDAGLSGSTLNSIENDCPDSPNGAEIGESGRQNTYVLFPESMSSIEGSTILFVEEFPVLCPGEPGSLPVAVSGFPLSFQWQIDNGNGFEDIVPDETFSATNTNILSISEVTPILGNSIFRLEIENICEGTVLLTPAIQPQIQESPVAEFTAVQSSPFNFTFTNTSENADIFLWDFGDGNNSTDINPIHTYETEDTFTVTLYAINSCDTNSFSLLVEAFQPPVDPQPAFGSNFVTGCAPFIITFSNLSSGDYEALNWSFPGGDPATSTEEQPVVTYASPGLYDVSLEISDATENYLISQQNYIEILPFPDAAFIITSLDTYTFQFINASINATSYNWNFGDGNTSTETSPTHQFQAPGLYTVTLNASNGNCAEAVSQNIQITVTSTEEITAAREILLYPNPVKDYLYLDSQHSSPVFIRIFHAQGKLLWEKNVEANGYLNMTTLPTGLYWIELNTKENRWIEKVIKH